MPFEFGDVVLLPFPFTDQSESKKRPAVVVSNAMYNSTMPDIIVMAVTSQLHANRAASEVWLGHWAAAGLLKPSAIKPVMATVEKSLIIQKMGELATIYADALKALISKVIG
jgi:mRNA interferase MazF